MHVSVVGLGKLGAPLAAVLSSKGHSVIGYDVSSATVEKVNKGEAPVPETGLQALMDDHPFVATGDIAQAVVNTSVTMIIVPTPSQEDGTFTNDYVIEAVQAIGAVLRAKEGYHVVVVCSTVMPGSTNGPIRAALEAASGRTVGLDLGLVYSPEFIALGSVINDMLNTDMILIGESNEFAGAVVATLLGSVSGAPVQRMSIVDAEIAKIAVNTYVTMKISFANNLAEICERIPGSDAHVITNAVGADTRIGRKYLRPGAAFGGPCFPRDTIAFTRMAHEAGVGAPLAVATGRVNRHQVARLFEKIKSLAAVGSWVGILGMSYKPETPVIEESTGLLLARLLIQAGYNVMCYDPMAGETVLRELNTTVQICSEAHDLARFCNVVAVTTPWPEFKDFAPKCFELKPELVVLDSWDILKDTAGPWAHNVLPVGVGL